MIVIIPSNREIRLDYLDPLINAGARFIVVDDTPGKINISHPSFEVYNWSHRKKMLGDLDDGIPRRTGACMSFGFYIAWRDAEPDEIIVTFGDDCEIKDAEFGRQVVQALSAQARPMMEGASSSFNILDAYRKPGPDDLFPRGFPYSQRPDYQPWRAGGTVTHPSSFNLGLWRGAFDVNAADKISGPSWDNPEAELSYPSVMVPLDPLLCVCSMNMQYKQFLIPAVYQLPMHVATLRHWVIDRYGDIWGGYILRRLMRLRGHYMSVGEPMIQHNKTAGFERNIWQEHIGHFVNDEFIDLLDRSVDEIQPSDYLSMTEALQEEMSRRANKSSSLLRPYLEHLLPCLHSWTKALRMARQ